MKYSSEFHDKKFAAGVARAIKKIAPLKKLRFMDVCGTHTMSIAREGIKDLLPANINLISGPGCPVCVTPDEDIDRVIGISGQKNTTIVTFGDMLKVPGTRSSLEKERGKGADVRIVISPLDALEICAKNSNRKIVFFAVGFETTSPGIAAAVAEAARRKIKNLFVYSSCKLIPPAMEALLKNRKVKIDGFICPGHVSTIIGSSAYEFIPREFGIPCVIAGFEPLDILQSVYMLLKQIREKRKKVEIQYKRCVAEEGNPVARKILSKVFRPSDAVWRGLGKIPRSGLVLRKEYKKFDAGSRAFPPRSISGRDLALPLRRVGRLVAKGAPNNEAKASNPKCRCGDVLCGIITPDKCGMFGGKCTPESPVGPCMVSSEGTCAAAFKYRHTSNVIRRTF